MMLGYAVAAPQKMVSHIRHLHFTLLDPQKYKPTYDCNADKASYSYQEEVENHHLATMIMLIVAVNLTLIKDR